MSVNMPNLRLPAKAKFWKKRSSADLTDVDPSYRAIYLGNVLTGWAKGDGCVDKPLSTLWKNHVGTDKPNIVMKVTVCPMGLKAVTKEHGLTEYWANRITFCTADPAYPKVFCWIYRHEGRKLKQELRCHAVLCTSTNKARLMAERLKARLHQALVDFKKEKLWRQNARLSLANSVYDNPTMPQRKLLLHTGSLNYRPPIERGKAASKLKMIEEVSSEEEEYSSDIEAPTMMTTQIPSSSSRTSDVCQIRSSDTYPLICEDDTDSEFARSSSFCSDNVSLASTVSTVIDASLNPNAGVQVSVEPQPTVAKRSKPWITSELTNFASIDDSDEDEVDLVTNHLEELKLLNGDAAASPNAAAVSQSHKNEEELSRLGQVVSNSKLAQSEQDTISDESGYSEESNATLSSSGLNGGAASRLPVAYAGDRGGAYKLPDNVVYDHDKTDSGNFRERKANVDDDGDLTVHGVLISEFSNSDRLKYLERSRQASFSGQIQPDFCINI